MKELLKKYVNSGATPTKHQLEYIFKKRSLFVSLVRKQLINKNKKFFSYNLVIIGEAIKKDFFNEKLRNDILNYIAPIENIGPLLISMIKYGKNVPEDVQLEAVSRSSDAIYVILDNGITPSEDVQLAAVSQNGDAIKHILDKGIIPSKDVQLTAVSNNSFAIEYIIDKGIVPSEDAQLAAVSKNVNAIKYILNKGITPSEDVQLAAVKKNPHAFFSIKNPHPSVINYINSLNK
jgi:hypothetical protein